jgi:hypothetical protein
MVGGIMWIKKEPAYREAYLQKTPGIIILK